MLAPVKKYVYPLLLGAFLLAPFSGMAEIYSWTDENGVRHYSDTPPQSAVQMNVEQEIPHDRERDRQNREAYMKMLEQTAEKQRQREKHELEGRLERTERQLRDTEKKAEQALQAAEKARTVAEEKQRRREIYVAPWIGPGYGPARPVPYERHPRRTPPRQAITP
ncbi:MAG: DUF4124 domain-containing protein [Deltaproteobacteria bacterium]|nr:DUF4124 domain-containing protein [Deltaproteobacteria bacterium]